MFSVFNDPLDHRIGCRCETCADNRLTPDHPGYAPDSDIIDDNQPTEQGDCEHLFVRTEHGLACVHCDPRNEGKQGDERLEDALDDLSAIVDTDIDGLLAIDELRELYYALRRRAEAAEVDRDARPTWDEVRDMLITAIIRHGRVNFMGRVRRAPEKADAIINQLYDRRKNE